jgi:FHA domain
MARTTIARELISLIQLRKADKAAILASLDAATSGAEQLRVGAPAVTVHVHQLRALKSDRPVARGTQMPEAAIYDPITTAHLYSLGDQARVDVLRFGRHPDQDIQLLDRLVSREHGLVIFSDGLPLFCDYGTLKQGGHTGSTNGTYLDGVMRISDAMITWPPGQALMLGSQQPRRGGDAFGFKLTYELNLAAFQPTTN